jgi:hypothetical protein
MIVPQEAAVAWAPELVVGTNVAGEWSSVKLPLLDRTLEGPGGFNDETAAIARSPLYGLRLAGPGTAGTRTVAAEWGRAVSYNYVQALNTGFFLVIESRRHRDN